MELFNVIGFLLGRHRLHVATKHIPIDTIVGACIPALSATVICSEIRSVDMVTYSLVEVPRDAFASDADADVSRRKVINSLFGLVLFGLFSVSCS